MPWVLFPWSTHLRAPRLGSAPGDLACDPFWIVSGQHSSSRAPPPAAARFRPAGPPLACRDHPPAAPRLKSPAAPAASPSSPKSFLPAQAHAQRALQDWARCHAGARPQQLHRRPCSHPNCALRAPGAARKAALARRAWRRRRRRQPLARNQPRARAPRGGPIADPRPTWHPANNLCRPPAGPTDAPGRPRPHPLLPPPLHVRAARPPRTPPAPDPTHPRPSPGSCAPPPSTPCRCCAPMPWRGGRPASDAGPPPAPAFLNPTHSWSRTRRPTLQVCSVPCRSGQAQQHMNLRTRQRCAAAPPAFEPPGRLQLHPAPARPARARHGVLGRGLPPAALPMCADGDTDSPGLSPDLPLLALCSTDVGPPLSPRGAPGGPYRRRAAPGIGPRAILCPRRHARAPQPALHAARSRGTEPPLAARAPAARGRPPAGVAWRGACRRGPPRQVAPSRCCAAYMF
jgi:hypothetical protein